MTEAGEKFVAALNNARRRGAEEFRARAVERLRRRGDHVQANDIAGLPLEPDNPATE